MESRRRVSPFALFVTPVGVYVGLGKHTDAVDQDALVAYFANDGDMGGHTI